MGQMRKQMIRQQIQNVAGPKKEGEVEEEGEEALRSIMRDEARSLLSSIDDDNNRGGDVGLPVFPTSKGNTTTALSGNVSFLSQLRLIATDKLKACQSRDRERLVADYQAKVQIMNKELHAKRNASHNILSSNDEHQMAKLCVFANAIEAPRLLEECMAYITNHFPKREKRWFLTVPSIIAPTNQSIINPSLSPSQPLPPHTSPNYPVQHTAPHSSNAVPSITPPNLTHSSPLPIEGQIPKQPPPTQKSPLPQPSPTPTSPLQPVRHMNHSTSTPSPVHLTTSTHSPILPLPTTLPTSRDPHSQDQHIPLPLPKTTSPSPPTFQFSPLSPQDTPPLNFISPSSQKHPTPPSSFITKGASDSNTQSQIQLQQRLQELRNIMYRNSSSTGPSNLANSISEVTPSSSRSSTQTLLNSHFSSHTLAETTPSSSLSAQPPQQTPLFNSHILSHTPIPPEITPSPSILSSQHSSSLNSHILSQTQHNNPTRSSLDAYFQSLNIISSGRNDPNAITDNKIKDSQTKLRVYPEIITHTHNELMDSQSSSGSTHSNHTDRSDHILQPEGTAHNANGIPTTPTTRLNLLGNHPIFPSASSVISNYDNRPEVGRSSIGFSDGNRDSILRTLLENYKTGKRDQLHLDSSASTLSNFDTHRPVTPSSFHNRIQNLLQSNMPNQSHHFTPSISSEPVHQSQSESTSQFVLGLLKDNNLKKPENVISSLAEDKLHREQILARIREETKKTYELNSKYRESINNVNKNEPNGTALEESEELSTENVNGRDHESDNEIERERKLLQQQQQEQHDAIRRAWGEPNSENENEKISNREGTPEGQTRHVRFGSSTEGGDNSSEEQDEAEKIGNHSSSPTNEVRVKEGIMLAKTRALEISLAVTQQKKQKLEEENAKQERANKLKRWLESTRETAKEEYRKAKEKKGEANSPQEIHPTPAELELLAKQEEEIRLRAHERVRESKAKMDQLRLRDEDEKRKKEQEKWAKRDAKLHQFVEQQRALQRLREEPLGSLAMLSASSSSFPSFTNGPPSSVSSSSVTRNSSPNPSLSSSGRTNASHTLSNSSNSSTSLKPRAGSAPRASVQSHISGKSTPNNLQELNGRVVGVHRPPRPASVGRPSISKPSLSSNDVNPSTRASIHSASQPENQTFPKANQPSKLLQPNFMARRRPSPFRAASVKDTAISYPVSVPNHVSHTPTPTRTSSETSETSKTSKANKISQNSSQIKVFSGTQIQLTSNNKTPMPLQPRAKLSQPQLQTQPKSSPPLPANTAIPSNDPPKSRTRHPSLATIALKKGSMVHSIPSSTSSSNPSNSFNHSKQTTPSLPTPPTYVARLSTVQEHRETEVFKEIEREINRGEDQQRWYEDQDILNSVENELFGALQK